jgi:DNA-binding transcriptional LysR family regulator
MRYFVTVADELHFGRAAKRLHITGPSLSQQIKALERDLAVRLFDRNRSGVTLTADGASLLPEVRRLLADSDALRRRAKGASPTPVRIGYVQWCPIDWAQRASAVAQVRVDKWVMPSSTQALRVAESSLDLAICCVQDIDLMRLDLEALLVGAHRLYAVCPGEDHSPVRARETCVLVDADTTWSSWNRYAVEFAADVGAHIEHVDDGGIVGDAFYDHVRRLRRPVVNSAKGQGALLPSDLSRRPITGPTPVWTWSLVARRANRSTAVRAVIEAFTHDVDSSILAEPTIWLPAADPHRTSPKKSSSTLSMDRGSTSPTAC